ncbi:MAG: hypothetical protein HYZ73_07770, partial [Elusimicrobia bacterium]|nr:hypothetical protein [Elusimicrobiota bacterium]
MTTGARGRGPFDPFDRLRAGWAQGRRAPLLILSGIIAGFISVGEGERQVVDGWLTQARSAVAPRLKVVAFLSPELTEAEQRSLQQQCAAFPNLQTFLKSPTAIAQELLTIPVLAESLKALD